MDSNIGARIDLVIKALEIKKVHFAEKLKIDQSYVTQLTNGKRNPSDRLISDICREFNVNEDWLRTGKGDPFEKLTRDEELADFLGKVSAGKDDFRRRFIAALAVLDVEDWEALEKIAAKLLEETKKADP